MRSVAGLCPALALQLRLSFRLRMFLFCSSVAIPHPSVKGLAQMAHVSRDLRLLARNIARLRRDIRLQVREMQTLIDADLDCSGAARVLMHLNNDLRLFLDKRERLTCSD
jgi:hypothetical protein